MVWDQYFYLFSLLKSALHDKAWKAVTNQFLELLTWAHFFLFYSQLQAHVEYGQELVDSAYSS